MDSPDQVIEEDYAVDLSLAQGLDRKQEAGSRGEEAGN
jgi:hypothetical protein